MLDREQGAAGLSTRINSATERSRSCTVHGARVATAASKVVGERELLCNGRHDLDVTLAELTVPLHVVEGSQTSAVDHAICNVIRKQVPQARHTLIDGAAT